MKYEDDSAADNGDTQEENRDSEESGISERTERAQQNTSSTKTEHKPNARPKKPFVVRMWRTLLRRRWFPIKGHPNWAEVVTLCVTVCLLAVGATQAYIYWQQSVLMENTLSQTDRSLILGNGQLIVANRNAKTAQETLTEMQNSSTDTHTVAEASKNQSVNTGHLAKQATFSAETARSALVMDQRPWLYVDNIELPVEPQLFVPFSFRGWMSNAGKTPGTEVLITEQTKWWNSEPEFPDFSNLPEPKPAQLVMPGIDKYEVVSTPATMDKFPYIGAYEQTRESRLYLLMKISYCDGFGNRYWTTMCVSHGYGDKPKDMRFCPHGNAVGQDPNSKSCPK